MWHGLFVNLMSLFLKKFNEWEYLGHRYSYLFIVMPTVPLVLCTVPLFLKEHLVKTHFSVV